MASVLFGKIAFYSEII